MDGQAMQQSPQVMPHVEKIVLAGMKLFYSKETSELRAALVAGKSDVIERLASNVTGLMQMLWDKSKGALPPADISPAALMLVYEIASFLKEAKVKITQDDIDQAVPITMQMLKELFVKLLSQKQGSGQPQQPAAQEQAPVAPQPPGGLLAQGGA